MSRARAFAIAALAFAAGCASDRPADPDPRPGPVEGAYARVEVSFATGGGLPPAAQTRLRTVVRQSALDWLDQHGRFAPDGQLSLAVRIESARLRSPWTTWLFSWAAPPDSVAARVSIAREGAHLAEFGVRVESGLSGYSWRDRDERLDRLARRLGHRLAEGL